MIKSILLVDDDPTVLRVTSKVLKARDYDVTVTESPDTAIKLLKQDPNQFDCILLDWKLKCPVDCDVIVKIIKYHHPDFSTPIVFITGHSQTATKYLLQIGAYDVLQKPVTTEQLIATIEHAIKREPQQPGSVDPAELSPKEIKRRRTAQQIVDAIYSTGSIQGAALKLKTSRSHIYRWLDAVGMRKFFTGDNQ